MKRTNCPEWAWFFATSYAIYIMNHTALESLDWLTPAGLLTGQTPDISIILRFTFWQLVLYDTPTNPQAIAHFAGFAEHVGHALTYQLWDPKTNELIFRSNIRPVDQGELRNRKAEEILLGYLEANPDQVGEEIEFVKLSSEMKAEGKESLPRIDPTDLIGRTFIKKYPKENNQEFRLEVVGEDCDNAEKELESKQSRINDHPSMKRFRCRRTDKEQIEVVEYNEILDYLEEGLEAEGTYKYKTILEHSGPHKVGDKDRMPGPSQFNMFMHWENGEKTWINRGLIPNRDPGLAQYAKDNGLLNTEGWKQYKKLVNRSDGKYIKRLANQLKLRAYRTATKYKYGYEVPRNHADAMRLDKKFGTTKWRDAEKLELSQLDEYDTFTDQGKDGIRPPGYNRITGHFVYDMKHDGRHKARYVAGGHLTPVPLESVYSSVVSLRSVRLVTFLAELNGLDLWGTDVGNAYLEAKTNEKLYIIAGPEFGELEGHMLIVNKALYGLRSSGARWHDRFFDVLAKEGFFPSKADPDVWLRDMGTHYEYVATYVDDLIIASKDPQSIIDALEKKHKFNLKGTGPLEFHLGCDYFRDEDGNLCVAPKRYIERMVVSFEQMFGHKPKQKYSSPLEKNDHPELDMSPLLDMDGIKRYQSLIGALQWAVSLGRIDVTTAVMTMSGFRIAPREGHLERLKRLYGFLYKMRHAKIRVCVEKPDYSDIQDPKHDWLHTVYGEVKEQTDKDAPRPLGKSVITTTYVDANLLHDLITGRSVTGVLHFVNQCLIDWFSRKQATVETSTYGSEFVAARTAVEQIMDLRHTLRYLGVPIDGQSYLFGDNESVVKSSTIPDSTLKKRHIVLSYHRVKEACASDMLTFTFIPGDMNPADILSKHWGYQQVWPLLRPILFMNWIPSVGELTKGSDKISVSSDQTKDGRIADTEDEPIANAEETKETVMDGINDMSASAIPNPKLRANQ